MKRCGYCGEKPAAFRMTCYYSIAEHLVSYFYCEKCFPGMQQAFPSLCWEAMEL